MVNEKTRADVVRKSLKLYRKAGIVLTEREKNSIEIVDEGLNDIYTLGLQIVVYVNTERVCAKEMALLPGQTCPEHMHPSTSEREGKEETFRVRYGEVYLYVPGEPTEPIRAKVPEAYQFSVFHEIILHAGEQYTIYPGTWHWFQAGKNGAVVSEFSTKSTDETDVFTDERMIRVEKCDG